MNGLAPSWGLANYNKNEGLMNVKKITLWVGLAIAVIGAFVTIPYAALILLVGGLVYGLWIEADNQVRAMVSAFVLTTFAESYTKAFADSAPAIGTHLAGIVSNLGALTAGVALMIVFRNIYARANA